MIALFALWIAAAPPLEVSARIEARDGGGILVGDPFRVIIEAKHAPGGVALLPENLPFNEDQLGERRASRKHLRLDQDGSEIDRYELELLAFESGELTIPPIPLALGSTHAETRAIALQIATSFTEEELPVATSTIPEAMPELEKMAAENPASIAVTVDDHRLYYVTGAVAALLIAALLFQRYWRSRKKELDAYVPPPPPPRPAHEVAFERLEALRQAGYLERGEKKTFFVELSAIVREYAGARFGFDSLELTLDELLRELSRRNTAGLDMQKLEYVLTIADLVKFAKMDAQLAEATAALSDAAEIVTRTQARAEG
jgi:hypothetical protein